jgi:GNAT superfamily N-acetyltransferase
MAVMLGAVEITRVEWSDTAAVRRFAELSERVRRADSPWVHPVTVEGCAGTLHHGWDGEPPLGFLGTVEGIDVALGEYETTSYDNRHLAWLGVDVDPDHRRRGFGTTVLRFLIERAVAGGKSSLGADSWDAPGPRAFLRRHGFEPKAVEINRRQLVRGLDRAGLDGLYDQLAPRAASYELVRRGGVTPADELEALARLTAAINDAPTDDLDIEDEVFPPERIAAYETAQAARGLALHRVLARHRETAELAGQTVVAVDCARPHIAHQHDTSVVRGHRGHRLGALLKLEMLRWLAEEHPQLESIDTWNAESNDRMIGVNEALRYEVVGRAIAYQRPV